ncbi:hypothetical protein I302_106605 [Kwoniella bestiolae CBS 10118]|uniref:Borealin N-terminal domain-containing protein n=1 Tax=Kwoniella bestiolae CBS 10118 TaxID=1296100 RepID=A0A1B9G0Y1_9TREE|nr:hypothetical protein I302_06134 [Kwoniella bestiolae CBS 10118]OCF24673.1 hypothetical protein I302_06134 [Kwoniella bestiolae CBS 10118]
MASTKTRRPPPTNVVMSTPPPQSRSKSMYSEVEKQGLLANFDIEVADKTLYFRSILSRTLASFRMREESEILSIPRELRGMTLGELESKWGGGWAGTLQKIRRESFEKKEKVREEKEEKEREEVVKGKRKRNGTATADNSPERGGKNPRRDAPTPSSTRKAQPPSSTTRSRATTAAANKKGKNAVASSSKGPSSLPQNHIFNPSLPPTPLFASRSNPNRPLTSPLSKSSTSAKSKPTTSSSHPPSDQCTSHSEEEEEEEEEDEDDDDLPNPEEIEAKILSSKTPSSKSSSSSRLKKKRGPSLIFRQSLAPNTVMNRKEEEDGEPLSHVNLSDGRVISFNPFNLTPGRVERELNEGDGGLSKDEKKKVQEKINEQVIKSLRERMERWKV